MSPKDRFNSDKPALLFVGNFLSNAIGTRGVGEDLSRRLTARGWQVITTSSRQFRPARLIEMVGTCWSRRQDYALAQVEVYSGLAFLWSEAVCEILRDLKKPYVLVLHGGNLPSFFQRWPNRGSRLLRSATAVTAPSPYLVERMLPYREDLRLVPNALDLHIYPFRARTAASPKLIWLRAFHSIYNPSLAVEAVARLVREFPSIQLLMIGPDKGDRSQEQTLETAARLGVAEHLKIHRAVSKLEVPRWLCQGDIFLNTTNIDNTPVSVMEAMACGLCVVTTDVGGIPYLFRHERDALLVPPNDPSAMASAIRRVLREPELAGQLSSGGRQRVEKFDWSLVLPQWEQLFEGLAGRTV
jgi:glycosyltransferase involved in cell wall biosynthesis